MRAESFEQLIGRLANFCRKQHQRRRQLAHRIALQQPPAISRLSISQSELASGAMRAVYITSDDDDDENKMMLHRWQHETTTTTRTSSSVIIFVISTCVLLLGLHLTQHTIGAIDDDIALPGFRAARAPLARAGSNLSAHYPTYYDLVKLSAERQTTDIVIAPQVDSTKSARKSNRRAIETSKLDDVSSAEPKHGTDRRAHRTDARGAKNRTNLLDEEIETMEALIEVLDAANKKLVEQKRRQKFKRAEGTNSSKSQPARADFSVTRASTGAAAANSFNATLGKRTRFDQEQPRADPSEQVESEATRDGAARPLRPSLSRAGLGEKEERRRTDSAGGESTGEKKKDKKRKFKRKKSKDRLAPYNATQILDSPSSRPSKLTKPLPEMRHLNESKRSTSSASSDSDQVRPGFDNTPMSQNYVGQYRAHPMGVTLDPLGGMAPAEPPEHMQQMHGPHLLLHGHRPIVAHDLLNTQQPPPPPQQQHEPNQYDNNIEDERVRHSGQPEVFVPDHVQQQPVGGDYRGFTGGGGPMYESHPQAPTTLGYPASPLQALQMLKRQQLLGYGPYQGLIQQHPAYGYSTTTERPHDKPVVSVSERDHNQPAGGSKPVDDWTPVAGAPVHAGKPHRGEPQAAGVEPAGPTPPTGHAPETATQPQTNQLLNNRFGDMNGGVNQLAGLGAPNPTLATMNPLQHLLDAAKNQQAAALAYERGRLNYELELRKREETMRQQHEANMERQRLAANQRAAAQEQERQNQQQSNELNGQREQSGTGDGNTGQQQNSDSGGEQPAQQDDNANQQEQEQPNDESANNQQQQQQQQDDPDMKNFQNFAGDTDFTDLFPKGVLSDAEIKEMREQQAEQKQRQEQEEQEEREKQRAQAEAEEEEQQQQQQEQPASGTSNEAGEQQQQPAQPSEGSANSSEQGAASQDAQQPQPQRNTTGSEVVTQPQQQQQVRSQSPANNSNANTTTNLVSQSSPPTAAIAGLPSYMLRNVSTAIANNQTGAQKTRRSRDHSQSSLPRPPSQPLLVLDSEYHDRYMKPFLNSLMTINKQQLSSQNDKSSLLRHSEPPPPPDDPGEWSQRKRRHEPTSGDQLMPLIDFDDLLEDYSDSLTNA